ncbi:hypothetical protein [Brevundimonas diminuta]
MQDASLYQAKHDGVLERRCHFARESSVRLGLIHDQALAAVSMGRKAKRNLALLLRQALYANQLHTGLISQGGA